ncbi:MAG: hypothetical protein WAV89_01480 [Ignavibacteriaceae bacterium]
MSYDNRLDNFDKLVRLLITLPEYAPNEIELSASSLQALHTNLLSLNSAVVNSYTALSNSRINRNNILYAPLTGLTDIAAGVKKYVKSVFGASSPEYKQVSGIQFKTVKD